MSEFKARKPPGRASHSTLTETAARAVAALARVKVLGYPGLISPKGGKGGAVRLLVTVEPGRLRIGVSGGGHQEVLVYGAVTREMVVPALVGEFGDRSVVVRDPHGLWNPEEDKCAPGGIKGTMPGMG